MENDEGFAGSRGSSTSPTIGTAPQLQERIRSNTVQDGEGIFVRRPRLLSELFVPLRSRGRGPVILTSSIGTQYSPPPSPTLPSSPPLRPNFQLGIPSCILNESSEDEGSSLDDSIIILSCSVGIQTAGDPPSPVRGGDIGVPRIPSFRRPNSNLAAIAEEVVNNVTNGNGCPYGDNVPIKPKTSEEAANGDFPPRKFNDDNYLLCYCGDIITFNESPKPRNYEHMGHVHYECGRFLDRKKKENSLRALETSEEIKEHLDRLPKINDANVKLLKFIRNGFRLEWRRPRPI